MSAIGISIYPERSTFEKDAAYIDLACKYGFKRVFTSLLEITGDSEGVISGFKKIVQYASDKGMEVMVDINPKLFKQLGVSYDNLSFFHELGAYGVRLDMGFTGREEAEMTRNPYGLKIEINMSGGTDYVNQILSYSPNLSNLLGSHNFYPMEYSGLDLDFFEACCHQFRGANVHTAAFITSQAGELGPWPVQSGLCTLEDHRFIPIEVQMKHMMLTGLIDDVLIGNAYATEEELAAMSRVWRNTHPTLKVELKESATPLERKIVLEELHSYRGDRSAYMLRSSMPRFVYRAEDVPPHDCDTIQPGDIVICNNEYGQYKGELHIALKEMENRGKINVVGHVATEEKGLVQYLKPWSKFSFEE